MLSKHIVVGADHGGFLLKTHIAHWLAAQYPTLTLTDAGTDSTDRVDYPTIAATVCTHLQAMPDAMGILVCGSGIGMSMAANRYTHIRAAVVTDALSAQLSRAHNNANVLCLGERLTTPLVAESLVTNWLSTPFDGERHHTRIQLFST